MFPLTTHNNECKLFYQSFNQDEINSPNTHSYIHIYICVYNNCWDTFNNRSTSMIKWTKKSGADYPPWKKKINLMILKVEALLHHNRDLSDQKYQNDAKITAVSYIYRLMCSHYYVITKTNIKTTSTQND